MLLYPEGHETERFLKLYLGMSAIIGSLLMAISSFLVSLTCCDFTGERVPEVQKMFLLAQWNLSLPHLAFFAQETPFSRYLLLEKQNRRRSPTAAHIFQLQNNEIP